MTDVLRIKRRLTGNAGAPTSLANAELAFNEVDNILYYGKGNNAGQAVTIIPIAGPGFVSGGGTTVTISDTAPGSPTAGNLWFDSLSANTYLYYNDGTSSQWVPVINQPTVNPIPIVNGGTGATNSAAALTNLGAVAKIGDTMSGSLIINQNAAVLPSLGSIPAQLQIGNADNVIGGICLDAFGTTQSLLHFRQARGTAAARTASLQNDYFFQLYAEGTSAANTYAQAGQLYLTARENWTATARGSAWYFNTIAPGTANLENPVIIGRGLIVGGSITNDPGPGVIYASSIYMTAKRNYLGSPAGTGGNNAVTSNDANILFYDYGGSNWAGLGSDTGGNMWLRSPNNPIPNIYLPGYSFEGGYGLFVQAASGYHAVLRLQNPNHSHSLISRWDNAFQLQDITAGGAVRIQINADGSCWNTNGVWNSLSDVNFKTKIADYPSGLNEILQLKPITFEWIDSVFGEGLQYGLIAQEVEPVMPELVSRINLTVHGKDISDVMSVNPGRIVYALINAIKELAAKIADMQAKINALEAA